MDGNISNYKTDKNTSTFDLHAGIGLAQGLNVGARIYFTERFSLEASYGNNIGIIGGGSLRYVYGLGVNYYLTRKSIFIISLLSAYSVLPNNFNHSIILSPNIGILTPKLKGFKLSLRGGLYFEYKKWNDGSGSESSIYPNIDLTIGWSF